MFKFKMSLLFNNTKFRAIVATMLLVATITSIIVIPKNKASEVKKSAVIESKDILVSLTGNGETKEIYKIFENNKPNGTRYFCVQEGAHLSQPTTYANTLDMMDKGAVEYFKDQKSYNSAIWLLNNMYIVTTEGNKDAMLINLANFLTSEQVKASVKSAYGIDGSNVNSQAIYNLRNKNVGSRVVNGTKIDMNSLELVEQIALWKYTKNADKTNVYEMYKNGELKGTNLSKDELATLKYYCFALITVADTKADVTPVNGSSSIVATLNKESAKLDKTTSQYGPYYLELTDQFKGKTVTLTTYKFGSEDDYKKGNATYTVSAEITLKDGSKINAGKEIFKQSTDGSFYIDLSSYKNYAKVEFKIGGILAGTATEANVFYNKTTQNVMNIKKKVLVTTLSDTILGHKDGKYSVELVKVREDGKTVITESEATFNINGKSENTKSGVLNVATDKVISDIEHTDSYEIVETKAPEGFQLMTGKLNLKVSFKENEKGDYVVDEEKTRANSTGFKNSTKFDVASNGTKIKVYIPNIEIGSYVLELYKVNEKGELVKSLAGFTVNEEPVITNGGVATVTVKKIESENQVDKYTIKEVNAPTNYVLFNGVIDLSVYAKKVDGVYVVDEEKTKSSFKVTEDSSTASIEFDGSVIKVFVKNNRKSFDMALRKYISKVNGEKVNPSREPVIDAESIKLLSETGTAAYHHTKECVDVAVGDEVEYTIRVYNEGEILGYAKQITDYLPEGLTFVKLSDDNSKAYTTNTPEGSKVVVIDFNDKLNTKNNVLSLRDFIGKDEINVTEKYYQEVKLICKVEETKNLYITNRAEITNYGFYDYDGNGNKTWFDAKKIGDVDVDSAQNTIGNELNLDTWYVNAKSHGEVKDYYPGAQDDDDFDTLRVLSGAYKIALNKVDENGNYLSGAVFATEGKNSAGKELKNYITTPVTTDGTADAKNVVKRGMTNADVELVDTYTITETKAPKGYYQLAEPITIKIEKGKAEDVLYVKNVTVNGKSVNTESDKPQKVTLDNIKLKDTNITAKISVSFDKKNSTLNIVVENVKIKGEYNFTLTKVDAVTTKVIEDETTTFDVNVYSKLSGATLSNKVELKNTNGEVIKTEGINAKTNGVAKIENIAIDIREIDAKTYYFEVTETKAPDKYTEIGYKVVIPVSFKYEGGKYVAKHQNDSAFALVKLADGSTSVKSLKDMATGVNGVVSTEQTDVAINVNVPNRPKEFDLALRKFITEVNGVKPEVSREPQVDVSKLASGEATTATYTHTKEPLLVQKDDIVTYTIRVYNEGEIDGYATKVMDDIPEGLEFLPDNDINKEFNWTMYKKLGKDQVTLLENMFVYNGENYAITKNPAEADLIITNYLSMKNGENNLIKAFDGKNLDYKDVNVAFKVVEPTTSDRIIINYAQVTKHTDYNGDDITDRDSTPNKWIDGEDDQDIEKIKVQYFDLALRKFITEVNGTKPEVSREPQVDVSKLVSGEATTATYNHTKEPLLVQNSDVVTYTIRVYNEGVMDAYATKVMDDIPEGLEFLPDNDTNKGYKWVMYRVAKAEELATAKNVLEYNNKKYIITNNAKEADVIVTDYLSKANSESNLIKAFDGKSLDYKDVKVAFKVIEPATSNKTIINYAQVTEHSDSNGNNVTDRDSTPNKWVEGEDDQDIEKIMLHYFDLALRKFITEVNGVKPETSREPQVDVSKLVSGEATTATYNHTKEPILVKKNDVVTYTLRVYNEGEIDGYASKVMDDIPEGLEFLPENELNKKYRWVMYRKVKDGEKISAETVVEYDKKKYVVTDNAKEADIIVTDYLSKENGEANLIKAFDGKTLDYKNVEVAFKVVEPETSNKVITNYAQITEHTDGNGNDITDGDSTPNEWIDGEDDQDTENIKVQYFDFALRKFITEVNGTKPEASREPKVDVSNLASGKATTATYNHTKEPVLIHTNDVVTYTLRVYNEGKVDGYASKVMDDIPQGLEFLPENDINKEFKWVMYREAKADEKVDQSKALKYDNKLFVITNNAKEADLIVTDYLSKANGENNLIKAFDGKTLDYKDVKVSFKVNEPTTSDRVIINYAQVTEHTNYNGEVVTDRDSTPNKWIDGEDDQDIEKIRVKYFDLSLLKYVSKAHVYENGVERVIETNHTGYEHPEPVLKVDLQNTKIKDVVVKFEYVIRVTNEGEIEGYAKEISDYIPEGLKFVAEDNKGWKEVDGKIVTDALANTLLKPGEYADVTVILTWINGEDNMGLKVNVAEISKDYNEYNTPDIDSTPNNKVPGEDDIDEAPVMLAIRTGMPKQYYGVALIFFAIIASGVVVIKKRVIGD